MKTEVYSWRIEPRLKSDLESAARAEKLSLAQLLERIAHDWLARIPTDTSGAEEQARLHAAVLPFIGAIECGETDRAANVRALLRKRLEERAGRRF